MARFKRILLKLSGESLMGKQGYGIDPERLADYARQIKEVQDMGVQIGIVIGGGNIFRGLSGSQKGFDRVKWPPNGYVCHRHQLARLEFCSRCIGCQKQGANRHSYGAYRRVV